MLETDSVLKCMEHIEYLADNDQKVAKVQC